jgi:hypothetical protein
MASSAPNKSLAARASAVLTTGEVAATRLDLNNAAVASNILVDIDFTLGMLTNVILKAYVSQDGSTYRQLREGAGATQYSVTLTASSTDCITAQGTGTVTNSLLALTYRYQREGSL